MNEPFFLTRQTANLMEDFAREIKAGSAMFLLYGDDGVGKSRLLQELTLTRLADTRVHPIELKSSDLDGKGSQDRSAEIEKIFVRAREGDTIIADHFETALKKTRHQLFLSWSTDGVDKHLNLIISSNTEGFNELRQLSSQYQVRVQSFQLQPFSPDEVEAFLGFYLFPDHPIGKLVIPAPVRSQLADSHGLVGEVIAIADREGGQIESAPLAEDESIRQGSWIIATVLTLFVLAIGIGWYLFSEPDSFETVDGDPIDSVMTEILAEAEPAPEPKPVAEATLSESELEFEPGDDATVASEHDPETAGVEQTETLALAATESKPTIEAEPEPELETETEFAIEAELEPEPQAEAEAETGPEIPADAESMAAPEAEPEAEAEVIGILEEHEEIAMVTENQAVGEDDAMVNVDEATISETVVDMPVTMAERFQRDLESSLAWLNQHAAPVGTIQILLLTYDGFNPRTYYKFVDKLERGQVDVSQLRIFKTFTTNKEVYSVFYGQYENRSAASNAIAQLPQTLQDTQPIPRSVGGIWQEIERLEGKN